MSLTWMWKMEDRLKKLLELPIDERRAYILSRAGDFDLKFLEFSLEKVRELRRQDLKRAMELVELLSLVGEVKDDLLYKAEAEAARSLVNISLGNYDQAIQNCLSARDLFAKAKKPLKAAIAESRLISVYTQTNRLTDGERLYKKLYRAFLLGNDPYERANLHSRMANLYLVHGRYDQANRCFQSAIRCFKKANKPLDVHIAIANRSLCEFHQGNYQLALKLAKKAGEFFRSNSLPILEGFTLMNSAMTNLRLARYFDALKEADTAKMIFKRNGIPKEQINACHILAEIYFHLNDYQKALSLCDQLIENYQRFGVELDAHQLLAHKAMCLERLNRKEEALAILARTEEFFLKNKDFQLLAENRLYQCKILLDLNELSKAKALLEKTEKYIRNRLKDLFGYPRYRAEIYYLKGLLHYQNGEYQKALLALKQAVKLAPDQIPYRDTFRYHHLLGKIYSLLGMEKEAYQAFKKAIKLMEMMGEGFYPLRKWFPEFYLDKFCLYEDFIGFCIKKKSNRWLKKGIDILEDYRNKYLIEKVETKVEAPVEVEMDKEREKRIEELKNRLEKLYQSLDRSGERRGQLNLRQGLILKERIKRTEDQLGELLLLHYRSKNHRAKSRLKTRRISFSLLQKSLPNHAAILDYFIINGQIFAFVIKKKEILLSQKLVDLSLVEREIKELVNAEIRILAGGIKREKINQPLLVRSIQKRLYHLYQALIQPLESELMGVKKLGIIPAGILYSVPFNALYDGREHLLNRLEINLSTSLAGIYSWLNENRREIKRVALVEAENKTLPWVRREAKEIARMLEKAQPGVRIKRIKKDQDIMRELRRKDLIHICAHSVFNTENPLFSHIQLGRSHLLLNQIYQLHLDKSMVVLSSCEGASNRTYSGEELVAMWDGFASAGAQKVIASLWQVDDQATFIFMRQFYKILLAGESSTRALQMAQIKMQKRYTHPFFWAGFVHFSLSKNEYEIAKNKHKEGKKER